MLLTPLLEVESRRGQRKAVAVIRRRAVLQNAAVSLALVVVVAEAPQHRVVAVSAVAHHAVRNADAAERRAEEVALQRHHALPHALRAACVDQKLHDDGGRFLPDDLFKKLRIFAAADLPEQIVLQHAVVGAVNVRLAAQAQRIAKGLLDAADALTRGVLVLLEHFEVAVPTGAQRLGARLTALVGVRAQAVGEEELSLLVDAGADSAFDLLHRLLGLKAGAKVAHQILRNAGERVVRQDEAIGRCLARLVVLEFHLLGLRPLDVPRFGCGLPLFRLALG